MTQSSPAFPDVDHDGFSDAASGGDDCDDSDPAIFPGASDASIDGVDQNCDGLDGPDADGDGAVDALAGGTDCDDSDASLTPLDDDGDGVSSCNGDCNDADSSIYPGAAEQCNNVDHDCNGVVADVCDFSLELNWTHPDDLDLHLLRPEPLWTSGGPRTDDDCYYTNCGGWGVPPDWGVVGDTSDDPALLMDDIAGTGPEVTAIGQPAGSPYEGWYQVMVHDYPFTVDFSGANDATLDISLNGALVQTLSFQMPAGEDSDFYVAQVHWPTGQIQTCSGLAGCP